MAAQRITVQFDDVQAGHLAAMAREEDRSVASLIRQMCREGYRRRVELGRVDPSAGVEPINMQIRPSEDAIRAAMAGDVTSPAACASHGGFKPSSGNALRCGRCGRRKAEH